jgi:hypothetical protein
MWTMNLLGRSAGDRRSPEPGGYDRSGAWTVDHAVRALATGCAERDRVVPPVGAVVLGPESVSVRLTTPDEAPPPGWTAESQGRTWRTSLDHLRDAVVDTRLPDPFPLLVPVGVIDEGRLLLNLAEALGVISLEGDTVLARRMIHTWSRRLGTSPWTAGTRVIRVGFEPDPDFAGVDVPRLADATPMLDDPAGGVLLFADRLEWGDLHQVNRLLAGSAQRWAVVAAGADDATWRFTVDMSGTIDTGLLAELVRPRS